MPFTHDDVRRIARLARIAVTDDEVSVVHEKLTGIFGLISEMQAADTRGATPMAHAQDLYQRLRDDSVTETDRRSDFQAVAPAVENGLYLVPKVIE